MTEISEVLDLDLSGKRALVTGSTRGLGLVTAQTLAQVGAGVGVLGRDDEGVEAAVTAVEDRRISNAQEIVGFTGDLSSTPGVNQVIESVGATEWDILIHSAGIALPRHLSEISNDDWNSTIAVNVTAPFLLSQALSVGMVERGWGRIVSVSSHSGLRTGAGSLSYSVSKAALQMLGKALAVELGPHGIRSNVICPTIFLSDMGRELWGDLNVLNEKIEQIPAKRLGTMTELAGLILFLVSPAGDYLNGAVISADGGLYAGRPARSGVDLADLDQAEISPKQRRSGTN